MLTHEQPSQADLRKVIAELSPNLKLTQEGLEACGQYLVNRFLGAYGLEAEDVMHFEIRTDNGFNLRYNINDRADQIRVGYRFEWDTYSETDEHMEMGEFDESIHQEEWKSGQDEEIFPLRKTLFRKLKSNHPDDKSLWDHASEELTDAAAFEAFNVVLDRALPNQPPQIS